MADSADLVVLATYYGTGRLGGMMATFLMGCWDEKSSQWKTVCKVGNGFTDKILKDLQGQIDVVKVGQSKSKIPHWLDVHNSHLPDCVVKNPRKYH